MNSTPRQNCKYYHEKMVVSLSKPIAVNNICELVSSIPSHSFLELHLATLSNFLFTFIFIQQRGKAILLLFESVLILQLINEKHLLNNNACMYNSSTSRLFILKQCIHNK